MAALTPLLAALPFGALSIELLITHSRGIKFWRDLNLRIFRKTRYDTCSFLCARHENAINNTWKFNARQTARLVFVRA